MSHRTVSSHGPGKTAASLVGQPVAGVPHTRVPSFGFGSEGSPEPGGSPAPSDGQLVVCPGGQLVNTPQISLVGQSAFDVQWIVGEWAACSAHAPSAKSSNAGQVLPGGGASTGGWQAAWHSAEVSPWAAHSSVQWLIASWTCCSVMVPNSAASVVVQTNGPNLGQGRPSTLQASSGSRGISPPPPSPVTSQTYPTAGLHEPAVQVAPDMLAHSGPLASGEPAAQFA